MYYRKFKNLTIINIVISLTHIFIDRRENIINIKYFATFLEKFLINKVPNLNINSLRFILTF